MRSHDPVIILLAAALALPGVASANPFPKADPAAGKRSFEEAKCNACHDKMTGGNGSRIFTRPDRKIASAPALLKMVRFCIDRTGASVFPEDAEHIAAYLNQQFYKFD
jgi:hypothetical protein